MSMKRSRKVSSSGKGSQGESGPFAFGGAAPAQKTWADAISDKPDGAFKPYSMSTTYQRDDLVSHPKFGKGVVTMVDGTRVEVLFEEGSKKLTHGAVS